MDIPFTVRRLEAGDIEPMLEICRGNELFYRYHPPLATRENLLQDLTALPPGRSMRDKFFVGFFDGDALIAMMDWVLGYPKADTVWIGFFMMHPAHQGRGTGSEIVQSACREWAAQGFESVQLAIDQGNPQSAAFWVKNGFSKTGKVADFSAYECMARAL